MDKDIILKDIRAIAYGGQPEHDITKLLLDHNCLYLLSKVTRKNEITLQLPAILSLNALAVKERYEACREVFAQLNGINYAVIKGAVLSQKIYGKPSYRRSNDIDLLISRDNADEVKEILLSNDFIQGRVLDNDIVPYTRQELLYHTALSHQMAPFIKKTGGRFCPFVNIDVNLDIMWGESKKKADMDYVLSDTTFSLIYGVNVKILNPVMEFISLCMHHYKDMNSIYLLSQGSLKLSPFCDIYDYLIHTCVNIEWLAEACHKLKVAEYVCYCIYYTDQIFNDTKLKPYVSALITEDFGRYLNSYGLDHNERREWQSDFISRLFDENFITNFNDSLTEMDINKIAANRNFM